MNWMDYIAEVQKVYPKAGMVINTNYTADRTYCRTRYLIQRDKYMAFTDCDQDDDFLTDREESYDPDMVEVNPLYPFEKLTKHDSTT